MNDKDFDRDNSLWSGALGFLKKISNALMSIRNWWENNAETICTYLEVFVEIGVWMSAVDKLAEEHLMFTDDLSIDFAHEITDSDNVQKTLENYYVNNDYESFDMLIVRCKNSKCLQNNKKFFEQIMSAYEREHFQLACTGMFALIDRVLADNTDNATDVNFKNRINVVKEKMSEKIELDEIDKKVFCIYSLMNAEKGSIFGSWSFNKKEPDLVNRNWLLHGRTNRNDSFFDFLLVLLWLDAIIFMVDLGNKEN